MELSPSTILRSPLLLKASLPHFRRQTFPATPLRITTLRCPPTPSATTRVTFASIRSSIKRQLPSFATANTPEGYSLHQTFQDQPAATATASSTSSIPRLQAEELVPSIKT